IVILSRTHVGLLKKLFEMEVPEIYEGIVRIESAAREPGGRAKIAVVSRDSDVDPVGACVGMRGSRVQAVVQELRGEKIDIVPWSPDPARFVCNAIQPAEVSRVVIDDDNHTMELIVPADQLSLAIGKRGQNVRLAAQLTGWRIDIISEEKVKAMEAEARTSLAEIPQLSDYIQDSLFRYGFHSAWEVLTASDEELCSVPGFTAEMAGRVREAARSTAELQQRRAVEESAHATCQALLERGALDERTRLLLVKGVGDKVIQQLARGGYYTVDDIVKEQDVDRFAQVTGLGGKKARKLFHFVQIYKAGEAAGWEMAGATAVVEGLGRFLGLIRAEGQEDAAAAPAGDGVVVSAGPDAPAPAGKEGASAPEVARS
ncbi:MAG TPA: transcription termination/antitermination protein NusA, partial [Myxococcota bacterium]|nr:transcription termination/antitermination protein NusA [Myxococcota bacterium]